jgi:hypothetical protein
VTCGHIEPSVGNSRNGRQISDEQAKAERQRVLRNNKAWRASESVRRNWLKTFIARKSAPKGSASFRLRRARSRQLPAARCVRQAAPHRLRVARSRAESPDRCHGRRERRTCTNDRSCPSAECARGPLRRTYIAQSRCSDSPVFVTTRRMGLRAVRDRAVRDQESPGRRVTICRSIIRRCFPSARPSPPSVERLVIIATVDGEGNQTTTLEWLPAEHGSCTRSSAGLRN